MKKFQQKPWVTKVIIGNANRMKVTRTNIAKTLSNRTKFMPPLRELMLLDEMSLEWKWLHLWDRLFDFFYKFIFFSKEQKVWLDQPLTKESLNASISTCCQCYDHFTLVIYNCKKQAAKVAKVL